MAVALLCNAVTYARSPKTDANITGHVLNERTGEHIDFITISLKGTTIGTSTDATGHYFLSNLPIGNYVLVASGIGIETTEMPVSIVKGRTIEVNFDVKESSVSVEEIVVSANRRETLRKESPVVVNIISAKNFELTSSNDLAQGLNYQSGMRVEMSCQNCGFPQVRINGLDGKYSQILIDSRPIFSSLAGVYGLEQMPTSMIDRVEVIRGGGSALFGSSAVAGVVNIITKEPTRNTFSVSNNSALIGGKNIDANTSFNASLVNDNRRSGMLVFGNVRQRNPYDANDDGFSEIGKLRSGTMGFRSYLRTSDHSKLTLEYHHITEYRRGGDSIDLLPHQANITEQTEHNINGGGANYSFFSHDQKHRASIYASAQHIHRNSYYGTHQDPNAYGSTKDLSAAAGTQYSYSFNQLWFMPAELLGGFEYNHNDLSDNMLAYRSNSINQTINVLGAFLQNEWKTANTTILVGARLDKHNMIDNPIVSPRLNLRQNLLPYLSARVSYSTGYRAPQAFDEDLHVSIVGGDAMLIELASDLKQESSHSVSGSFEFNKMLFDGSVKSYFLVEGFYTKLNNVFVLEEDRRDENNNLIIQRRNGKGAAVKGINLEGAMDISKDWQLQSGYTFQRSLYEEPLKWSENANLPDQKTMFRSPDHYGYFTAAWMGVKRLTLSLTGVVTGSMQVQHIKGYTGAGGDYVSTDEVKQTPVFFDATAKAAYQIPFSRSMNMEISGGVQNFLNSYQKDLDQGIDRDSKYIYGSAYPVTPFVGVKFFL